MSDTTRFDPEPDDATAGFQHAVRPALLHLHDNAFLQNHSLTAPWAGATPGDRLTHVQDLRRALLGSIEHLRPQSTEHGAGARLRRAYLPLRRWADE